MIQDDVYLYFGSALVYIVDHLAIELPGYMVFILNGQSHKSIPDRFSHANIKAGA